MAGSINKVILVGNLGRDPEIRSTQDGREIANLAIATSESWKDKVTIDKQADISINEIIQWIDDNKPLIVDLRQPISFKTAHIPDSINLPYDHLDSMLNTTNPFCTKQKILLVCPLGEKSALVASYLKNRNIDAYNLQGGINAWRDQDLSLERDL